MPLDEDCTTGSVTNQASGYSRLFISTLFVGFVATGAATVLLAPMLPLLAAKWSLSDETTGTLFTCQFLGSIVGTLASGYLVHHVRFGKTLGAGYLLMCTFAFGILATRWPWLPVLAAVNGLGLGLVIPATNMAISDSFPRSRASALNLVNLSWSVGAIACPVVLAYAVRTGTLSTTLVSIAVLLFAMALLVMRAHVSHQSEKQTTGILQLPRTPFVILAVLFFLYVGSEGAVAGWLATYAKRTVMPSGVLWMTAPSFFWAAIMLGRAISPFVLRRIEERHVLTVGLVISAAGVAFVLYGKTSGAVLTGAAVSGLGMSSIFPIFIAMVSEYAREFSSRVSPYMFAMAGLGGAVLPWLVGLVSYHSGQLRVGLIVAIGGVIAQLILSFILVGLKPAPETELS